MSTSAKILTGIVLFVVVTLMCGLINALVFKSKAKKLNTNKEGLTDKYLDKKNGNFINLFKFIGLWFVAAIVVTILGVIHPLFWLGYLPLMVWSISVNWNEIKDLK
jgi:hypothetical protein